MALSEKSWIEAYYEIVAFLYWDSRILGHRNDPASKLSLSRASERLRSGETPLNHHIKHFLYLAPTSLRNRIRGRILAL